MTGPKGENLTDLIDEFFATGAEVQRLPAGPARCVDNEGLSWKQANERSWQRRQMLQGAQQ